MQICIEPGAVVAWQAEAASSLQTAIILFSARRDARPTKKFYGTDNCLPLSAEFIFNRKGAAVFAHSRGAG